MIQVDYVTPPSFRCYGYGTFGGKKHPHKQNQKQQGISILVKIFSRKCRSTVLLKDFLIMLKLPLSHWNLVGFSPHHELQVHHEFVNMFL